MLGVDVGLLDGESDGLAEGIGVVNIVGIIDGSDDGLLDGSEDG